MSPDLGSIIQSVTARETGNTSLRLHTFSLHCSKGRGQGAKVSETPVPYVLETNGGKDFDGHLSCAKCFHIYLPAEVNRPVLSFPDWRQTMGFCYLLSKARSLPPNPSLGGLLISHGV